MATKAQMKGYGFSFQLEGIKELLEYFDQMPTIAMKKTVVRNALKKAAQPIADEAISNVPVGKTGNLRDSIAVSTHLRESQHERREDRNTVTVYVGSSAPHAHLIEFGTVQRALKKPHIVKINGSTVVITSTGRMTPIPFLRNAWDATKDKAVFLLGQYMWEEILKASRRLVKRGEKGKLTKTQIGGLLK